MILIAAVTATAPATASASASNCWRVLDHVTAGAFPVLADFAPAACDRPNHGLRYDRASGLARAARDLQPGEVVRAASPAMIGRRRPGDPLTLKAQVGPVLVERQVVVLRPLRGESVLVRAADGTVFATSLAGDRP